MYFEFDIPKNQPARYFKLAVYREQDVLTRNDKTKRPAFFTDDGVGTAVFAEWVLLSFAATKITGAAAGGNATGAPSARATLSISGSPTADGLPSSDMRTHGKATTGAVRWRSSRSKPPSPTLPQPVIRDIIYDPPVFLTKPVVTPAVPNPLFIEQDEAWVLPFNYISNEGLLQKQVEVSYEADTAKATALSGHRTSGLHWTETRGIATFDAYRATAAPSAVTIQALPVPAHAADTITRAPNSRVGKTENYPGNLERRYYDFHIRARDRNDVWSDRTDGLSGRPPPVRVYLFRSLRASRLSASIVPLPLTQRTPSFTAGRPTNGYISLSIDVAHASLTHQQDTGNWPDDIKVAWYRSHRHSGWSAAGTALCLHLRLPGQTGRTRPVPGTRRVSATGAEWVPTSNMFSTRLPARTCSKRCRDDGEYPLRWGEYISPGRPTPAPTPSAAYQTAPTPSGWMCGTYTENEPPPPSPRMSPSTCPQSKMSSPSHAPTTGMATSSKLLPGTM